MIGLGNPRLQRVHGWCGVDLADQSISYYTVQRSSRRWYMRMFHHVLDITTWNSFLIAQEMYDGNKATFADYFATEPRIGTRVQFQIKGLAFAMRDMALRLDPSLGTTAHPWRARPVEVTRKRTYTVAVAQEDRGRCAGCVARVRCSWYCKGCDAYACKKCAGQDGEKWEHTDFRIRKDHSK